VKDDEHVAGEFLIFQQYQKVSYCRLHRRILLSGSMRDVIYLLFHLLTTLQGCFDLVAVKLSSLKTSF